MLTLVDSISDKFVEKYKDKMPPWGPVGYVVYKRTYSRKVETVVDGVVQKRKEEWWETVRRCVNSILKIGCKMTKEEAESLYDKVFNLKCSFGGRSLWQLGTATVDKLGGDSLQNCWCCCVNNPVESFCFLFDELMLGGGVGLNIQAEHVYEMPKVKYDVKVVRRDEKDVDFVVPDNREGWVDLLRRTLQAFFFTGKSFCYSTICVRGKGATIKGFGGVASGPEDLCWGIDQIANILRGRVGKKLRPIDCLDICNIIGAVVVAGNVRRSAEIMLGDANDDLYLDAKNWGKGQIPNWRSKSNNSIICNHFDELPAKFWSGYNGDGEAYGLVNLRNCRLYGRLADGKDYRPDKNVVGTNPCGEVPLNDRESCNLAELFLPNIKDEAEFKQCAELMYKVVKAISCLPFIHDETNAVVRENHRLGIGVTGFLQAGHLRNEKIFDNVYKHIEKIDKEYSRQYGVKPSIRLTTVKPSGTLSLLAGVTPGGHPGYSLYHIRRIEMDSTDPLVAISAKHGYHVEPKLMLDGTRDLNTMVVEFPVKFPDTTVCAKDLTAVQQMDWAKWLQTHWSDNSVSVTVYYKKEELPAIKDWLKENYDKHIKTLSFCLHSEHGYKQAPFEEISKEKYEELVAKVKPIVRIASDDGDETLKGNLECSSASCPVK
jgi:adenosylcobalamin-dependent ribonucleoside-triphosphate reductase